jgi:2-C-methyl-D-erythritol 4-phosphate cytidylyltransferase
MNIAVILSGGNGKRMNMNKSKQLLDIGGKEVFRHSLDFFRENNIISHVVVVYNPEYKSDFENLAELGDISLVECGDERWESSFNALKFIKNNFSQCEKVFIHDGARPFLNEKVLNELYMECNKDIATVPGLPLKDTVKQIDENGFVICTPDRHSLVCVQTPQVFDFNTLYELYVKMDFFKNSVTDDASVWELSGKKVKIIEGNFENIKITTREDIIIAQIYADKLK